MQRNVANQLRGRGQTVEPVAWVGGNAPEHERIIGWQAPPLKFGVGATREIGYELRRAGVRSVLLVTDRVLAGLGLPARVAKLIEQEGISVSVFDRAQVEPTDESCTEAARELASLQVDGYVGLGGGSSIDTAKMLNLLLSYPGRSVRDYLNAPIGAGAKIPGPLKPLVAVPTTAGSGSECTAMVALGVSGLNVKTGISDLRLLPSLALVDPANTLTLPPAVTASSGYDVLTHACESYTARAYDRRPPYPTPADRPLYIGANPISDVWVEQALGLVGRYLRRAVLNPDDLEARIGMSQAASFAGMGFGNAGTHIPHACAYPIAGLVRDYRPEGYAVDHAMVPHGAAVVSTAAAAFEFTYLTSPERHLRAAELLGANLNGVTTANGSDVLPATLQRLVADTGGPGGLAAFGYSGKDLPALVEGALKQQRLLVCCPRDVASRDLQRILSGSMAG
ncbi:hydroxyacid-oxoacid transhydrogenase [Streptomyces sp. ISL-86]|uniref:hydroxyacid-oxoacid transhydrogenase n=1 Tax=Streptomyces sp. ISL-86 TaxID=2819187 RepID=UPI001BE65AFF|nr:hydroxyacid-oxoacid transhydrogenase [Streptomyces sp. ISL-86]MBT2457421.1 iron-containing alcohol dehydrogenase [Streptomyces sp. ISL-86]